MPTISNNQLAASYLSDSDMRNTKVCRDICTHSAGLHMFPHVDTADQCSDQWHARNWLQYTQSDTDKCMTSARPRMFHRSGMDRQHNRRYWTGNSHQSNLPGTYIGKCLSHWCKRHCFDKGLKRIRRCSSRRTSLHNLYCTDSRMSLLCLCNSRVHKALIGCKGGKEIHTRCP